MEEDALIQESKVRLTLSGRAFLSEAAKRAQAVQIILNSEGSQISLDSFFSATREPVERKAQQSPHQRALFLLNLYNLGPLPKVEVFESLGYKIRNDVDLLLKDYTEMGIATVERSLASYTKANMPPEKVAPVLGSGPLTRKIVALWEEIVEGKIEGVSPIQELTIDDFAALLPGTSRDPIRKILVGLSDQGYLQGKFTGMSKTLVSLTDIGSQIVEQGILPIWELAEAYEEISPISPVLTSPTEVSVDAFNTYLYETRNFPVLSRALARLAFRYAGEGKSIDDLKKLFYHIPADHPLWQSSKSIREVLVNCYSRLVIFHLQKFKSSNYKNGLDVEERLGYAREALINGVDFLIDKTREDPAYIKIDPGSYLSTAIWRGIDDAKKQYSSTIYVPKHIRAEVTELLAKIDLWKTNHPGEKFHMDVLTKDPKERARIAGLLETIHQLNMRSIYEPASPSSTQSLGETIPTQTRLEQDKNAFEESELAKKLLKKGFTKLELQILNLVLGLEGEKMPYELMSNVLDLSPITIRKRYRAILERLKVLMADDPEILALLVKQNGKGEEED